MPKEKTLTESSKTELTSTSGTAPAQISAKYDPQNPPQGWDYVNYKHQPGGGFRCPNCGAVEDGNDVDGHNCNP